ncbi:MAG: lipooligosaccharide transport system permease protein [Actinomycetota bacterium]|jgi:lipooligosaccharide transport system permease protein|nr:lipooligosaccharide transport system permease protein [Actinomycetota bacterium]
MSTSALRLSSVFLGRSRASLVLERNFLVYRHLWVIIFSGFFEPLFYLFAAKVGLGQLVGDVRDGSGHAISYTEFIAPALLASSAMNGAVYESTMNIFFKLKFAKTYDAMLATPLGPFDIALGEITWSLLRGAIYATGFLLIMWATGLAQSPWTVMALPAALLIGFAFAAVGMACTSYMKSWQDFDKVNLAVLILFLFSATFFPITVYPPSIRLLAQLSPLYHGVSLIRGLTLGNIQPTLLLHAAFLVAMGATGLAITRVRLTKLLLK